MILKCQVYEKEKKKGQQKISKVKQISFPASIELFDHTKRASLATLVEANRHYNFLCHHDQQQKQKKTLHSDLCLEALEGEGIINIFICQTEGSEEVKQRYS